jgi:hypothetical protein
LANESSQEFMGVMLFASGGARTHNLRLRRPTLYPVELRTRIARMVNLLLGGVKHSRREQGTRSDDRFPRWSFTRRLGRQGPAKNEKHERNHERKRPPDADTGTDNFFILSPFACEIDHLGI